MHLAMVDFISTMAYSLFRYAQNAGMDNITHQYCKNIVKGSFYGTPAMQNIDIGSNTAEDLRNQTYNEQDNTEEAHGDDC